MHIQTIISNIYLLIIIRVRQLIASISLETELSLNLYN